MTAFEKKCREVADSFGVDVSFFEDDEKQDPFHDDGTLHVLNRTGTNRACFNVGADDNVEANKKTREILTALKMKSKITNRVLVEEKVIEDECPHCGK